MNVVPKFTELEKLFQLFGDLIPDKMDETYEVDGNKLHIVRDGDNISVSVETIEEEEFDDSEVIEFVKEFKENIKELDDQVFVECVESTSLDLNRFNELLKLEHFTEDEAEEVLEMIDSFTELIMHNLTHKINKLVELSKKF